MLKIDSRIVTSNVNKNKTEVEVLIPKTVTIQDRFSSANQLSILSYKIIQFQYSK